MAGRIPQVFIDELLERTDLVELIQRYVPLKKSGNEFSACCPFHGEKTPSFFVSPRKQFYHCFGCGAHGTAISFLMEHENLSFPEAIELLADWAGLEIPREADSPGTEPTGHLYAALDAAATFYVQQLKTAGPAIAYLKARGIDGSTARDFAIGWAPPGKDLLVRGLQGRFDSEDLIQAGLVARRDDGSLRDRFRARIQFPIRDRRGRVTGFGGRLIDPGEPKYLNSPESAVFHKGHMVYGLFEARRAETRLDELVVTEGYMDVISLAQAGFHRAVACMGTALTRSHLELLFRQVSRLVLCFDGDAAGRRAAWRSIEQALPVMQGTREVRVLFLPEGDDPDSLVRREGLDGWRQRLDGATVLSETLMSLLAERHPLETAEGRSHFAHEAVKLVRGVTDPLFRGQLTGLIAERARSPEPRIEAMLDEGTDAPPPDSALRTPGPTRLNPAGPHQLWGALLARILQFPEGPWDATEVLRLARTDTRAATILAAILERITAGPNVSTGRLLEHFRGEPFFERLAELASVPLGDESPELSAQIALDSAARLLQDHSRERLRQLCASGNPLGAEEIEELKRLRASLSGKDRTH